MSHTLVVIQPATLDDARAGSTVVNTFLGFRDARTLAQECVREHPELVIYVNRSIDQETVAIVRRKDDPGVTSRTSSTPDAPHDLQPKPVCVAS